MKMTIIITNFRKRVLISTKIIYHKRREILEHEVYYTKEHMKKVSRA